MNEPRTVTATELLSIRERGWARKLAAVSLCAEVTISSDHLEQTLKVLGRRFRSATSDLQRAARLTRYPAVHVLSTTLVAAEHYDSGTFWPKLSQIIEHDMSADDQRIWGRAFLDNLRTLDMPTFDGSSDAGTRYVGRILLHGGIPSSDLHDFYRLIAHRRQQTQGLTAEEFIEWAQQGALPIGAPAKRFLRHGGEFAVDVAERTFELLDLVHRGGDPNGAMLPQRFVDAVTVLAQQEVVGTARHSETGAESGTRPAIVLQPFGQGVVLRLPPVSEAPDGTAVWLVGMEGQRIRVATKAAWPGSAEPAPSTDVTVTSPVRGVTAALETHTHLVASVPVVDDVFPMLGFDEQGRRLLGGVWPDSSAWLLIPGGEDALVVEGAYEVRLRGHLPPGWAGWTLLLVDLSEATGVGLVGNPFRQRLRRRIAAQLHFAEPVVGVMTDAGEAVWSEAPEIELPDDGSEGEWDVSVLDSTGAVLTSWTYTGGGMATDIWGEVEVPLVGTYTVRIRGPWGRGLTRTFTIIEGLVVDTSPPWRRFDGDGLLPATSMVKVGEGLSLSEPLLGFGPRDVRQRLRVWNGLRSRSLVVEPPHMSVLFQTGETTLGPRTRPIPLASEDIAEEGGELVVLTGTQASPTLHFVSGGASVQTLVPRQQQGATTHRVDLSALSDTLSHHPVGRLCLDPEGILEVASVRPRRLLTGVDLERHDLVLRDAVDQPGMVAIAYSLTAPWLPPVSLPVAQGHATLPDHLRDAGSLRVTVRIEDPWFPEPLPPWPEPGRSYLVETRGYVASAGSVALAALLAGETGEDVEAQNCPADLAEAEVGLGHLWVVAGRRSGLALGDRVTAVLSAVQARLQADPGRSLRALADSPLDLDQQVEALVWSRLSSLPVQNGGGRGLRFDERALLPTVLRLAPCPALEAWAEHWVEGCGAGAADLLAGKEDPHLRAGRIDAQVDFYSQMGPAERARLKAGLGLVPHGALHPDARVLAAMALVDLAKDERLVPYFKKAEIIVRDALALLEAAGCAGLRRSVLERNHPVCPRGWRAGTAASLAVAIAARLAARGVAEAHAFNKTYGWALRTLASHVPQLVRTDLVLAENLLRGLQSPEVVATDDLDDPEEDD